MKHFLKVSFCIALVFLSAYSTAFAKLYRNTEYQFSIEIPDYMEYRTPRGPNVKMSAYAKGGNPNIAIIVKPNQEIAVSSNAILAGMYLEDKKLESTTMKLISADIIPIPEHNMLCTIWLKKYTYPEITFYMTLYMFEFVSNYKYYHISYGVEPGTEAKYEEMITRSIGSFVDETGWY